MRLSWGTVIKLWKQVITFWMNRWQVCQKKEEQKRASRFCFGTFACTNCEKKQPNSNRKSRMAAKLCERLIIVTFGGWPFPQNRFWRNFPIWQRLQHVNDIRILRSISCRQPPPWNHSSRQCREIIRYAFKPQTPWRRAFTRRVWFYVLTIPSLASCPFFSKNPLKQCTQSSRFTQCSR